MGLKSRVSAFVLTIFLLTLVPNIHATTRDRITMNGYFSMEYEKTIGGDDEEDTNGSFDLDLIDIVINFNPTDKLRIATDLTWEHATATEDGWGNAAVEYAFAEYMISSLFRIKAGKNVH